MTEHHHTFSGTTEAHPLNYGTTIVASPLEQHYVDGSISRDIILLLPILDVPRHDEQPSPCLHLVHLPDGNLGLCNVKTEHTCPCCGNSACNKHLSEHTVLFPDEMNVWSEEYTAPLCETCALLPKETIYALHAFRLSINESEEVW